ncbi:hypothetical protein IscW_ISCW011297 [Ixodes scapularis]|uniref:Uncharacterized protein n=1 Tax=Ixodes scapularis TaxID=6945 RepID=B7Q829_IXOSC|nr:hypothetical protein IscW_ISCW011297 [Ixodes scapularis]|eukprot:XP_002412268.1 hypothetical protein IscW_ISCW011297 [Ixodes scapularis]
MVCIPTLSSTDDVWELLAQIHIAILVLYDISAYVYVARRLKAAIITPCMSKDVSPFWQVFKCDAAFSL